MEHSPWTLDIETNGIREVCRELRVTKVANSPLGHVFLTIYLFKIFFIIYKILTITRLFCF